MENLIWIILVIIGSIMFYVGFMQIFLTKRAIKKTEKQVKIWFDLVEGDTSSSEQIRNRVSEIIKLYKECDIPDDNLKLETVKLLYHYVYAAGMVTSSDASIATASSDTDTSRQEENLSHSSRKKELLEKVLVNLFMCIKEDRKSGQN